MKQISKRGVNYLDIMLALAFLGVLAGLSIPVLVKREARTDLHRATDMISSSMLLTRQRAAASGIRHRITFDYENNEFRIYREQPVGGWALDPPDNRYQLPASVHISDTSVPRSGSILIDERGNLRILDDTVLIRLDDRDGGRLQMRVTGAGTIQELPQW